LQFRVVKWCPELAATTDTEQQEIGKDGNVQKFLAAATLKGKDVRSLPNR
jgi:hypothetical protein